jgi:hypothetical protein
MAAKGKGVGRTTGRKAAEKAPARSAAAKKATSYAAPTEKPRIRVAAAKKAAPRVMAVKKTAAVRPSRTSEALNELRRETHSLSERADRLLERLG